MPFELVLAPGERFVINGATVVNGDREALLQMNDNAAVLRASEIMQPQDANTPARRIFFTIQMMYLDGERREMHYDGFVLRVIEYISVEQDREALLICLDVSRAVRARACSEALRLCKDLIAREQEPRMTSSLEEHDEDVTWV